MIFNKKKVKFLLTFFIGTIFIFLSGRFLNSAEKSGVVRGGFVIEQNGNENNASGNNEQKDKKNQSVREKKEPDSKLPVGPDEKDTSGVKRGTIIFDRHGNKVIQQENAKNKNKRVSEAEKKKPDKQIKSKDQEKKNTLKKDKVDYTKIYFVIISALILFLYLIFGMKKRGRGRSSHSSSNSNRYLK